MLVGVAVLVGVLVGVAVLVGVSVCVLVEVIVFVGVVVLVGVNVGVGVGVKQTPAGLNAAQSPQSEYVPFIKSVNIFQLTDVYSSRLTTALVHPVKFIDGICK